MTTKEYFATLTPAQLKTTEVILDMIANIISQEGMTVNDLIGCLMSEPYRLAPTEENLDMIINLLNLKDTVYGVKFVRSHKNLSVEPVIHS